MSFGHSHVSDHDHSNGHNHTTERNRYFLLFIVAVGTFLAQLLFGLWSGSIAVVSDAFHTIMHSVGFLVSVRAAHVVGEMCAKGASEKKQNRTRARYGLINALVLFVGISIICAEAYKKFINPIEVFGGIMFGGAVIGVGGNYLSLLILQSGKEKNEIQQWNLLHIVLDLGISLAVLAAAPVIYFFQFYLIDSILSFAIAGIVLITTLHLLFTKTFRNLL